jgi:sulfotransferase family protein
MERGPVYVAGLERSGTSLMYALLASHPRIAMTRRTNLWRHFYLRYGDLDDAANLERCLETMRRYKRLVTLGIDWDGIRRDLERGARSYSRLFHLVEQQHADRMGKPRWGDKSLLTERFADPILDAYPQARILHMIRDPRDRFASSYARWKIRRGGIGAGTAEWLSSARLAMRNERSFPGRYRSVRYESLVTEPEVTLREICSFIGEDYAPEMLEMDGAPSIRDGGNSSYGRLGETGVSTSSIGRFSQVLSPRQVAYMQLLAGNEMAWFGYERVPVRMPLAARLGFAIRDVPLESAHLMAWRTRESIRDRAGRPLRPSRLVDEGRAA